jgi:hypothetical protein
MRRSVPVVYSKRAGQLAVLHGWAADRGRGQIEINLDSDEWFAWLEVGQSFRFSYWYASGETVNVTVRPEKRGERLYWQGWKTISGQTLKKYIAPSPQMTKAKLDTMAEWFYQQVKARAAENEELKLYAAVADLTWLVEQLLSQGPTPALAERAQREVRRIKRSFGN